MQTLRVPFQKRIIMAQTLRLAERHFARLGSNFLVKRFGPPTRFPHLGQYNSRIPQCKKNLTLPVATICGNLQG
jgi:hypothetical protein